MGKKLKLDENLIVKKYLEGKSSIMLEKELGVSKPTILKILKKNNAIRNRDRCKSLKIKRVDNSYIVLRKCPKCSISIKVSSNNQSITCRNYFKLQNSLCKKCSLEQQKGQGNPFYGKKHTEESKKKISESRKGKSLGSNNPMSNKEWKLKVSKNLKKRWDSGDLDHLRIFLSENIKKTRRSGKMKSVNKSKKEIEILNEIKKRKYKVLGSYKIDTKICDIYIPKLNLIIEYFGDYWHCNPLKYDENYFNKKKNMTAKEIWKYDENKIDLIKKYGYNLEIVWESDLKSDPNLINKLINNYDRK